MTFSTLCVYMYGKIRFYFQPWPSTIRPLKGQIWIRKHKIASISLTVRDTVISSKFWAPRLSKQYAMLSFKKWQPFWIFKFLPKMKKHKIASSSLYMWDLSKFSALRVCKQDTVPNCQKLSSFQKFLNKLLVTPNTNDMFVDIL